MFGPASDPVIQTFERKVKFERECIFLSIIIINHYNQFIQL